MSGEIAHDAGEDLKVWREGACGRLRMNRPQALNAMSYEMMRGISAALLAWREDDRVRSVLIDAAGDRAFCAGGDIQQLYRAGPDKPDFARRFWREEYRLNALIAAYPKPYVAFMHGVTMGGGVGVSAHGSHRVVSEGAKVAMPECAIGFLPDVGGTWLLGRAPGESGRYLGMTGARMDASDAIYAGFADHFAPRETLGAIAEALVDGADADAAVARGAAPAPPSALAARQSVVDDVFGAPTALGCVQRAETLVDAGHDAAGGIAAALRANAPISVAATFAATARAKELKLTQALALEYRFAHRAATSWNFFEGIRAAVIDKDRTPKWRPERLEAATDDMVAAMFAPLAEDEWRAEG